jgi:hypothetical protein
MKKGVVNKQSSFNLKKKKEVFPFGQFKSEPVMLIE